MSIYKGGYLTIDCGGQDILTESGITVPGISDAVKTAFGKIVILQNVLIGDPFKYFILDNFNDSVSSYDYTNTEIAISIGKENDNIIATAIE